MKKPLMASAVVIFAAAIIGVLTPGAVAGNGQTKCGSVPAPAAGSTVKGGLEVDGTCTLINVTVNGGKLDVNATTNGSGAPTGTTATINGGINFNAGTGLPFADADIRTATINGGIDFTGALPLSAQAFCGNDISGAVNFHDFPP